MVSVKFLPNFCLKIDFAENYAWAEARLYVPPYPIVKSSEEIKKVYPMSSPKPVAFPRQNSTSGLGQGLSQVQLAI